MKTFLSITFITIIMLVAVGCKLDNFEPLGALHPPLSVTAVSTNVNTVHITFWALNNEEYFSGYNVFIGTTYQSVTNMSTPLTNTATQSLPFYQKSSFQYATQITIAISNDNSGAPLSGTLYIGVSAYSLQESFNSPLSDVTNVNVM